MKRFHKPLVVVALALIALWSAFFYAPTETTMGDLQRIFYFHVPAAIMGFVAALVVALGGIMFLTTQELKWDQLAVSSAELCVLFVGSALAMGSIWAKPAWGAWWAWDSRGTLQLLLLIVYSAYLVLRVYVPNPSKQAALSAVFGILGAIDVPFNYMSIRWFRTQHPSALTYFDTEMQVALVICFGFMLTLYLFLLEKRMAMERHRHELQSLEQAWERQ